MGTSRKAPSGPKHAACLHHEAYASAPSGWLCFAQASDPTDDDLLERMVWADDLEASRMAHRAAWAASLERPATGVGYGASAGMGDWTRPTRTPDAYAADLGTIAEPVSFADYTEEAAA